MKNAWIAAGSALAVLALGACSADDLTAEQLWSAAGSGGTLEGDVPKNLDEMAARATLIVRASIASIEEGPTLVHTLPEGTAQDRSRLLTLDISEVIDGVAPEDVAVQFQLLDGDLPTTTSPPAGEYVWFLEPAGVEDYWMTASTLGVIGELDGQVTTVRSIDSGFVNEDFAGVSDVVEEIKGRLATGG